jgi:hypothetical protein
MKSNDVRVVSSALRIYFFANTLIAAIGLLVLLWIPTDPKNVWLFGYSKNRLALIVVFLFFVLLFAYFAIKSYRNPRFNQVLVQKAIDVVTGYRLILLVLFPLYGLAIISVLIYFSMQIKYLAITTYQVFFDRLLPLLLFGLSLFVLTYLVIILISIRFPITQSDNRTQYINPKKVFIFLLSVMGLLILLSVSLNLLHLLDIPVFRVTRRIFDLKAERNIPTLYSSVTLLVSAMLLGYIAHLKKITGGRYSLYWAILAFGFIFLSVDETAYIHENFSEDVAGWIFVVGPFVILFFLMYIRFFLHLPRSTKLYFLSAAFLFIGGAFFLEYVGSWQISLAGENILATTLIYTTVEETFEMLGINLFVYSLLLYLRDNFSVYYLSFQNPNQ